MSVVACPTWTAYPHRVHHALIVHHHVPKPVIIEDQCLPYDQGGAGGFWSDTGWNGGGGGGFVLAGGSGNVGHWGLTPHQQMGTPETPTWLLLLLGFGFLFCFRRRRVTTAL